MGSDEATIRDTIERWHRATAAGDIAAVARLMAEDVVFLVPGKAPVKGRAAFVRDLEQLLATHRIESTGEVLEVAVAGKLAYAWTLLTVRILPRDGGDAAVRSGNALSIFRKQIDRSWILARDANLPGPPA